MSLFSVDVLKIDKVTPHANADKLELVIIKGWQVVIVKGQFKEGDTAIYVPVDAVIPLELSEKWGVTKYLNNQRVRAARLRGEMSYGFLAPNDENLEVGLDVSEKYGIIKYVQPEELNMGDNETPHPSFDKYTDIENIKNFPDIIQPGEKVVFTEKIHGTNSRVGLIAKDSEIIPIAGSHTMRKKLIEGTRYSKPYFIPGVREMLEAIFAKKYASVVIAYGEIYGYKIQDLQYGLNKNADFRVFDIKVNGSYLDWDEVIKYCREYGVKYVPELYRGPFDMELAKKYSTGNTTLTTEKQIREGIVIHPLKERNDPKLGRVILKLINDDYILRKNGTEFH
ncbi:RNA ligase (ATP) [Candidatus Pacearchaeota archaeon]|nr:RNA ligase (ATP) [Candidatus Pacearchaeota archaeon]